jgi:isopentenyldiphosphate isomerase
MRGAFSLRDPVTTRDDPGLEIIDVLDDAGNPVGRATRREVRARRLPHRCTYVLVFNPAGDLLIHRRTETKDVFPGYWDVTVGGVLGLGEDWRNGARREALEEIGVAIQPEFLFDIHYASDRAVAFGKVYRAVHAGPFRLQPEEVVEAAFIRPARLEVLFAERPFCPDGVAVWNRFARGLVSGS